MIAAVRNGLFNSLANVAGAATGIVGSILIVNSLSAEAYGQFSYYLWLAGIVGLLGTLALPVSLLKLISELRGQGAAAEIVRLTRWVTVRTVALNLALTLSILLWALNAPTVQPEQQPYLFVLAAFPLTNALARLLSSLFWGYERYGRVSSTTSVVAVIQLALIIGVYLVYPTGWAFALAMLSSSLFITLGLAWGRPKGEVKEVSRATLAPDTRRRYLHFFIPATPGLIFQILLWDRSEIFFLNLMSTVEQIGFYSLAYTVFRIFLGLGWSLVNGFFPSISKDFGSGDMASLQRKVSSGVLLATLFAVPLSFGGWATFEGLFALIYGEKMLPAVPVAYVLFAGLVPGVVSCVFGLVIAALNKMWWSLSINFSLALINIVLDVLLIPSMGAYGGAIANTSAQLGAALLAFFVMKRVLAPFLSLTLPWGSLLAVVAIGAATAYGLPVLVQWTLPGTVGLLLAVPTAAASYLLLVWKLGFLTPFFGTDTPAQAPQAQVSGT